MCCPAGVFQWRAQSRAAVTAHIGGQARERIVCAVSWAHSGGRSALCSHWGHCGWRLCICWIQVSQHSGLFL